MDLHGGSLSTVSTGAQAIPGHSTRDDGECYFLGSKISHTVVGPVEVQHLIEHSTSNWMTAPLPTFRKLYGRIEEDLDVDDVIVVHLENNYSTYSFGGKKKLVLSTLSWLGGKNDFLGVANLFVGAFCILISIIFLLLHVKNPRPYGDTAYISWNRKNIAS
ncbi:hypothetical protein JHK86_042960 [Glycine max]|nr:hypothetical protein JHK86_042960 [Glycine max]